MCRNIRTLHNFEPPATEEEIRASALQFVRKLSGFTRPAKGLAAGEEGKFRCKPRGFGHGSADRRMRKFWRVGPLGASFHVRKLIAQRGDAALGEPPRNAVHERVEHSRSRPMREDIAGARVRRHRQQPADAGCVIDRNGHGRDI